MSGLEIWLTGLAMVVIGATCIWLSLTLFAEYRKAFMANPLSVMSLDMLMIGLRCGPPGVMAFVGLLGGALLGGSGILLIAFLAKSDAAQVWHAIKLTLGLGG